MPVADCVYALDRLTVLANHGSVSRPIVLTDGTVTLRVFEPDDAGAVFAACQDPEIARFLPIPQPYTEEDARHFVARRRADWKGEDERSFAITHAASGRLLGAIARHRRGQHRAEVGYWLAREARGHGYASRALRLLAEWSLSEQRLIRLELYTHPDNARSGRVAERAGFSREGVRRAWDVDRDGRPEDAVFYVLIRGDHSAGR
jgi:RimJ/RimL family protein N-acetyltransferase